MTFWHSVHLHSFQRSFVRGIPSCSQYKGWAIVWNQTRKRKREEKEKGKCPIRLFISVQYFGSRFVESNVKQLKALQFGDMTTLIMNWLSPSCIPFCTVNRSRKRFSIEKRFGLNIRLACISEHSSICMWR